MASVHRDRLLKQNRSVFCASKAGTSVLVFCGRITFWKTIIFFWVKFMLERVVRAWAVYFKVFYSIVGLISIYMMNMLIFFKGSSNKLFQNKTVLGLMFIRGISLFYVSICRMCNAAFPRRAFFATCSFFNSTSSKYVLSFIPGGLSLFKFGLDRRPLSFDKGGSWNYSSLLSFIPRNKSFGKWHVFNYNMTGDTIT